MASPTLDEMQGEERRRRHPHLGMGLGSLAALGVAAAFLPDLTQAGVQALGPKPRVRTPFPAPATTLGEVGTHLGTGGPLLRAGLAQNWDKTQRGWEVAGARMNQRLRNARQFLEQDTSPWFRGRAAALGSRVSGGYNALFGPAGSLTRASEWVDRVGRTELRMPALGVGKALKWANRTDISPWFRKQGSTIGNWGRRGYNALVGPVGSLTRASEWLGRMGSTELHMPALGIGKALKWANRADISPWFRRQGSAIASRVRRGYNALAGPTGSLTRASNWLDALGRTPIKSPSLRGLGAAIGRTPLWSPRGVASWAKANISSFRAPVGRAVGRGLATAGRTALMAPIAGVGLLGSKRMAIAGLGLAAGAGVLLGGMAAFAAFNPRMRGASAQMGGPMRVMGSGTPMFGASHGPMSPNNLATSGLSLALYNTRKTGR